jgi:hypothetical protein
MRCTERRPSDASCQFERSGWTAISELICQLQRADVNMPRAWKSSKPHVNRFEAIVGDRTTYQVHYAESAAVDTAGIEATVIEIVRKALGFAEANKGNRSKRLLFLWHVVYATLTVVFTDDSMMYDAHHVTKCYFAELDKAGTAGDLSDDMRRMIASSLAQSRRGLRPPTMPVYYSDQDRASEGANFKAQQLTNG